MRRKPETARSLALAFVLAAAVVTDVAAQGVSFRAPGRVPREHDTAIGSATTGDPALDYTLHCQGCHQADGAGLAGAVPRLRDSVARLVTKPGGREYLAQVPGVAQSQLDDAAVAQLLNWLLARFDAEHLPADFRPFTAEEVAPLRRDPLVAASKVRAEILGETSPAY